MLKIVSNQDLDNKNDNQDLQKICDGNLISFFELLYEWDLKEQEKIGKINDETKI